MGAKQSAGSAVRAVQKLIGSKQALSAQTERAILEHGDAAVEPLLELLADLDNGFACSHAARLLGKLQATRAIEPLIEVVLTTEWDDIVHDAALLALAEIGPAIVDPALAHLETVDNDDEDARPALVSALASCGAKDERVYEVLLHEFEQHGWRTAVELAAYGDERAIPVIRAALSENRFGCESEELQDGAVVDFCDSLEELGATLTEDEQAKAEAARARRRKRYPASQSDVLTTEELELAEFLEDCDEAMTLAEAKGYLTAVATAPTAVAPSVWLDVVLGEEPAFDSVEHANQICGFLLQLYNKQITVLEERGSITPVHDVEDWCAGYLVAIDMDDAWRSDEDGASFSIPMAILSGALDLVGTEDSEGNVIEDPSRQIGLAHARLELTVHEAYAYWSSWRQKAMRAVSTKIGRNEPCPCGSGKKYKKCCGLAN